MNTNLANREHLFYWLFGFVVIFLMTTVLIIQNNSVRSSPVFIFLLLSGIGAMLGLGLARGGLVGLGLISIWIVTKQAIGVWQEELLTLNALEIAAAGSAIVLVGIYQGRLRGMLELLSRYEAQLKQFDIEDKAVGLVKPDIGRLRLIEEEERSVRYHRPFSLVLVMVAPRPGVDWEPQEGNGILRAVAAHVKDTTRHTDIPFLAGSNRIAVILPEAETEGASKVVNNIVRRMISARMVTGSGQSTVIQDRAQIRFGFSTFLGQSDEPIHMMAAAEESLRKSVDANTGEIYQSLFIEWETVGEKFVANPVLEVAAGRKVKMAAPAAALLRRNHDENCE